MVISRYEHRYLGAGREPQRLIFIRMTLFGQHAGPTVYT